jgi:glutaredoxin-like protein NrdH
MTKHALDKHSIPFESVDVSQDQKALEYVRGLGYSAAPVVVVDEERHWSGFRPESIAGLKELV